MPSYGLYIHTEKLYVNREERKQVYGCAMGKVWKELDEDKIGKYYCYVDPAKHIAFNPSNKLIHLKLLKNGDGIYIYDSSLTIKDNEIMGNTTIYFGGGIYIFSDCSSIIGSADISDKDNFNAICGNTPGQLYPDPAAYPNNFYICLLLTLGKANWFFWCWIEGRKITKVRVDKKISAFWLIPEFSQA